MGGMLSYPIKSQLFQRKGNENYLVASSEMQGFRMHMEDTHMIALSLSEDHPELSLFGVFDGHGGDKAAIFTEEHLQARIGQLNDPTDQDELQQAMMDFDQEFLAREDERTHGTTCIFVIVRPTKQTDKSELKDEDGVYELTVVNIGDSRAMLIKSDGECIPLSTDHKPSNPAEKQRIYDAGGTVQGNRVDGGLAIARTIGDGSYKADKSLPYHKQKVIVWPDVKKFKASRDDVLLICCDGLVEAMTNEDVAEIVHKELKTYKDDPAELLSRLIHESIARGSTDNHSCLIVLFQDGTSYARKDEFRPGPFTAHQEDDRFKQQYLADAKKHGYEGEELMALITETEKSFSVSSMK